MQAGKGLIRAQRLVASASGVSRRAADDLIGAGRVTSGGVKVALGQALSPTSEISVDGKQIFGGGVPPPPVYLAFHKPPSVLSAWRDASSQTTLTDVLTQFPPPVRPAVALPRLLHVGRLDFESEGLLLLTSNGVWANSISHPSQEVEKRYVVACSRAVPGGAAARYEHTRALCRALERGVALEGEDRPARAAAAVPLGYEAAKDAFSACRAPLPGQAQASSLEYLQVTLRGEGRHRVVRRMLLASGYTVKRLLRTSVGGVTLEGIAWGKCRALRPQEVKLFM